MLHSPFPDLSFPPKTLRSSHKCKALLVLHPVPLSNVAMLLALLCCPQNAVELPSWNGFRQAILSLAIYITKDITFNKLHLPSKYGNHLGLLFINAKQKNVGLWHTWYFCHKFQPSLWHCWYSYFGHIFHWPHISVFFMTSLVQVLWLHISDFLWCHWYRYFGHILQTSLWHY